MLVVKKRPKLELPSTLHGHLSPFVPPTRPLHQQTPLAQYDPLPMLLPRICCESCSQLLLL
ncbi:hypothetical protein JHK82_012644 [Glycine max]|uniref:Uncharacterized protein n=2 Tax=Glycine subgen. Soja TaxID=1462606 RepID=A0A0R0K480_SOYBN|nr:hypothetical protein JHK85_012997 [Glycine max]RZC12011.1 hypothetical protein D0Y65_011995 [Glycine soja]KAG5057667.1 hypothetical protein JHK86_012663 [Glycine max]KAG5154675.1 hypothetical protein JHK82_012644 [Glycine max]KAH1133878.1 hypothetical protein GYH30_012333 [Glycine max]